MSTGPEEIEPLESISTVAHERSVFAGGAPRKRVADIVKGNQDRDGEIIEFVFFRRVNYAIYRAAGMIRVQCADDEAIGTKQATMISELLALSFRLEDRLTHVDDPRPYHWQIAEALRLGLAGQARAARMVLQAATNKLAAVVTIEQRLKYVVSAGIAAALCVAAAAIAVLLRLQYLQAASAWDHVLLAAAAGATGALISQTIGIPAAMATSVSFTPSDRGTQAVKRRGNCPVTNAKTGGRRVKFSGCETFAAPRPFGKRHSGRGTPPSRRS
jgi:hypothetical protein